MSEPLLNQPVACYFFNKRPRLFLVDIAELSRIPFLQEYHETPDTVFMEHICNYNIKKINVNYPKRLFEPFEKLIKLKCTDVKLKLRQHEKLFSFFSSDSAKFVIKCG